MKNYGYNTTTEFTRKQINVIFAKAKKGELKVEKWFINECYKLADFYGIDWSRSIEFLEGNVNRILRAVFSNDNEAAQELIDIYSSQWYNSYTDKEKKKVDRTAFV